MNATTELLFLGLPETGKTTYFIALDEVLLRGNAEHGLVSGGFAANRSYIEASKKAWRAGKAVERTNRMTMDEPVELLVRHPKSDTGARLIAPDVNGEFFDGQWVDRKWPVSYRARLASTAGIFVFINAAVNGRNPEMTEAWKNLPHDFTVGDMKDFTSFAAKLQHPSGQIAAFLASALSNTTKQTLLQHQSPASPSSPLQMGLVNDLNGMIAGPSIYHEQRFAGIVLRSETQRLLARNPSGMNLIRLNRLLLEDALPAELSKRTAKPWEPRFAAKQVKVVDLIQNIAEKGQIKQPIPLAVMLSAWDVIEPRGAPKIRPDEFLRTEWSLLHQYLQANPELFRSRIFGVSARGGGDSNQSELVRLLPHERVWLKDGVEVTKDITRPLRFLLGWE